MAAQVNQAALHDLVEQLPALYEEGRSLGHDVDGDPYLMIDSVGLARRYLIATDGNIAEAARRIRATIAWRHDWRVLEYHKVGAAQQLFSEATNPGSEMYFAKACHCDREHRPFIVGRVHFANPENMHPWRHLRAGIFVVERAAIEVMRAGCGYGSYILDVGGVEPPIAGTFSGTAGDGQKRQESNNPYYQRGAGCEAPQHLVKEFGELNGGMSVLRAAIAITNNHYPELMCRVVVLRSNWLFSAAFRVFSLWMHKRSREKFVFVGGGWMNPPIQKLLDWYSPEELPEEFGGSGWRLEGDNFMRNAVKAYDSDPTLVPCNGVSSGCMQGYAGLTPQECLMAERDARDRAQERGETAGVYSTIDPQTGPDQDQERHPLVSQVNSHAYNVASMEGSCCLPCLGRHRHKGAEDKVQVGKLDSAAGPSRRLTKDNEKLLKLGGCSTVAEARGRRRQTVGMWKRSALQWWMTSVAVVILVAAFSLHLGAVYR